MLWGESNKMVRRIHSVDLNYSVKDIFPISIHQFKINDFDDIKDELIDYVYDAQRKDWEGANHSNIGGWQSKLIDFSQYKNSDLFNNFFGDILCNLPFGNKRYSYNIDAWLNINKNGHFNMPHIHPTSHLSGVVWLKCPKNCGRIVFTSPYEFTGFKEMELYNEEFQAQHSSYTSYHFIPTEGHIILFPSHLMHDVRKNESNQDRISIAFNIGFS